jgi:hypothetical protein
MLVKQIMVFYLKRVYISGVVSYNWYVIHGSYMNPVNCLEMFKTEVNNISI